MNNSEGCLSTIRYPQTAEALTKLLGMEIDCWDSTIEMETGDRAIVFRLVFPKGWPRIDPSDKGKLAEAVLKGFWELGLLTKLS